MVELKQLLVSKQSLFKLEREPWDIYNDYVEDFKIITRQRELYRIPFLHQSPQIQYRKNLIEYLKSYVAEKEMSYSCLHLAVYIMDIFMDNHTITPEKLHLVANSCLLLAAKFEEQNLNIPRFDELNAAVESRYTYNDYKKVEIIILKFFHWYLALPTPAHYVHYYRQAILTSKETSQDRMTVAKLGEFIHVYLDKVVEDIHFMQSYTPSKLAAAIISAARRQTGLESWTEELEQFTDYTKEQIRDPVQALLKPPTECSSCLKRTD